MGSVFLTAPELKVMVVRNGHVIFCSSQSDFFNLSLSVITYHAHVFMFPFIMIWNYSIHSNVLIPWPTPASFIFHWLLLGSYLVTVTVFHFSYSPHHSQLVTLTFGPQINFWTHTSTLLLYNRSGRWVERGWGEKAFESCYRNNCTPDSPT